MSLLRNIFGKWTGNWTGKWTGNYTGANRQDKGTQKSIQKRLSKGKDINVKNVSSSRWNGLTAKEYDGNDASNVEEQVSSTCVDTIKYDPISREMNMTFRSNPDKEYSFPNVPEYVITEWLDSPSKGMYYHNVIDGYSINHRRYT